MPTRLQPDEVRLYGAVLEVRDVDVAGRGPYTHIEGRAVPYSTWADVGWYLEQHQAGSFARSTTGGAGRTLPLLLFHDNHSFPIGGSVEWTSEEDGLHGAWALNDRPEAQEAAKLARSGELGYLSIGFSPIRSEWEFADDWDPGEYAKKDKVTRVESRLLEVSMVATPAFETAQITLVRHRIERGERADGAPAVPPPPGHPRLDEWRRERAMLER